MQNQIVKTDSTTYLPAKRRFGDRAEGRRIRSIDPMAIVAPFIMSSRVGSQNLFQDSVNLAAMERFVHKKREEGLAGFGAMHVLIAAYVRTISQRPGINRFLSGLRLYARHNIEIVMAIKKAMNLEAEETMMKFFFDHRATVTDVFLQMNKKIEEYQTKKEEKESAFDKVARLLGYMPRFQLKAAIAFFNWLDFHNWLPEPLRRVSPFHCSAVFSSMGSLGIQPVFHHLYDFGNAPVFITFSTMRKSTEFDRDGTLHRIRHLDLAVTTDERICDGFYYASAFHELRKYLKNPELLDEPPEQVICDVD
ncbi:hypothetical protein HMPREF9194_01442 [Treponema maltophilum ATCC 51939]|uniref:2-oxoacid dehydrogenase acyltransferase catalytic domain-containing protein n=1 Tax=Treponema maltophilum ATCC 51939 TaxID=1125699 RepID=S3JYM4_TREMA|nr:hypothetical protein [Treponema maltophilum]EPF31108.1 hypothetical protein HMPREF9194_01442 [Treponema maltophilum ATCC 51939]